MSAPTETGPAPAVEEPKVDAAPAVDPTREVATETPAAEPAVEATPAVEPTKTEEPATETPATTEETPATTEASPAEPAKPKSPSFLQKLLAPLKNKTPKSPKKVKTEREIMQGWKETNELNTTATATELEPTPAVEPATTETEATSQAPVETPAVVEETPAPAEPVVEAAPATTEETPAATEETPAAEEKPVKKPAIKKTSRRLSARVGDLFKGKPKKDAVHTAPKVEEAPPRLEEPGPVAPLETSATTEEAPAAEETPAVAPTTEETSAPAVEAPRAALIVAATA